MTVERIDHPERMMTQLTKTEEGIALTFADECRGVIPFSDLPEVRDPEEVTGVELPNPFLIRVYSSKRDPIEIPWDFARHYCDSSYRPKTEAIASAGLKAMGNRIRRYRKAAGMTQAKLASEAKIGRVTIARIENGKQSPSYHTLQAIASAIREPVDHLVIDDSPRTTLEGMETRLQDSDPRFTIDKAMELASNDEWQSALALLRHVGSTLASEHAITFDRELHSVWACIQRVSIMPAIENAEKSLLSLDYGEACNAIGYVLSICEESKMSLDYEHVISLLRLSLGICRAADTWRKDIDAKLNRLVTENEQVYPSMTYEFEHSLDKRPRSSGTRIPLGLAPSIPGADKIRRGMQN